MIRSPVLHAALSELSDKVSDKVSDPAGRGELCSSAVLDIPSLLLVTLRAGKRRVFSWKSLHE